MIGSFIILLAAVGALLWILYGLFAGRRKP